MTWQLSIRQIPRRSRSPGPPLTARLLRPLQPRPLLPSSISSSRLLSCSSPMSRWPNSTRFPKHSCNLARSARRSYVAPAARYVTKFTVEYDGLLCFVFGLVSAATTSVPQRLLPSHLVGMGFSGGEGPARASHQPRTHQLLAVRLPLRWRYRWQSSKRCCGFLSTRRHGAVLEGADLFWWRGSNARRWPVELRASDEHEGSLQDMRESPRRLPADPRRGFDAASVGSSEPG